MELLSNTSVTIKNIGFRASVEIKPADELVGSFSCSKIVYDKVWDLGARAVQASCVEAYTQPSTWQISKEGAYIRGQQPGISAAGAYFGQYNVSFTTKITRGGTGWKVAADENQNYGAEFVLTTDGPQLLNTDTSVVPPNTLIAGYGYSIVNFYLGSATPIHYPNPFPIHENEWYRISTFLGPSGYNVSVNGTQFAYVPYASFGGSDLNTGSWGFGPYLDQAAYYKDVKVIAHNGTVLYTDPLTSTDILQEYRVASNEYSVCLDGAKRDREIWIGDFAHTARELASSTGRYDFIRSMIEFTFLGQFTSGPAVGIVPIQDSMGSGLQYQSVFYPSQYGETDYQLFFILTLGDYFALTQDTAFYSKHWDGVKLVVDAMVSNYLNPQTYLLDNSSASWFTAPGEQNATAPTALFVVGLQQLAVVASALKDAKTSNYYSALSANISTAINVLNWNPMLGAYNTAFGGGGTGVLATAFTLRAGITNNSQATTSIQALSDLFYLIGYKDTSTTGNSSTTTLSPNTQGFLLESLFIAYTQLDVSVDIVAPVLHNLLDVYWPKMVNQNEYSTGCPWEYVYADGAPGLGLFTSLCHPWGGAPTYVLTDYVLGVRRELTSKTGQYEWVFDPPLKLLKRLGLTSANGKVPLQNGGWIKASWALENEYVKSHVEVIGAPGVTVHSKIPKKYKN